MEKVLRKVNCKDRLPEKSGNYIVHEKDNKQDYNILSFTIENDIDIKWFKHYVEYWYEEVDLDKIIVLEKQKYLLELSHAYQGTDMFDFLASERFEKAKKILLDGNYVRTSIKYIEKALRVAAGMKDEVC